MNDYAAQIKQTFQRLFWEAWVERFTTERMWRIWQIGHPVEWQGPLHPAHIIELIGILERTVRDNTPRSIH